MIRKATLDALEPWVGRVAADTCVRATAIATGKDVEEFGRDEVLTLCGNVRRLLAPMAPSHAIDQVVAAIEAAQ